MKKGTLPPFWPLRRLCVIFISSRYEIEGLLQKDAITDECVELREGGHCTGGRTGKGRRVFHRQRDGSCIHALMGCDSCLPNAKTLPRVS